MVTTDVLATFLMAAAAQRCKRRRVIQELASHHLKPGAGSLLHQVGRCQTLSFAKPAQQSLQ